MTVRAAKLATVAETCNDSRALLLPLIALASLPSSAVAADSITYAPGGGADVVKIVAGLAYVGLLAFWLFKVIGRRIKRSTTEVKLASLTCVCKTGMRHSLDMLVIQSLCYAR